MRRNTQFASGAASWSFIGVSPGRRRALDLAQRIAGSNCPVFITGPTGVGKDVLAEDIHRHSLRAGHEFVALNCAALTTTLFESELFGHRRGAFTSAATSKRGLVEIADGGTLFLDEVGELPLDTQAKLLRFLSKGTFWPLGATKESSADVRVIAATNRDLHAMLDSSFRADLFFRLSVITVAVPPLEAVDVKSMARVFAAEICARDDLLVHPQDLDKLAELASIRAYRGGARELRNIVERYFLLYGSGKFTDAGWREASDLGAPGLRSAPRIEPDVVGEPDVVLRHLDDMLFLITARHVNTVRELSQRINRSIPAVYSRLAKLGLKPGQLGRTEAVERAIHEVRRSLLAQGGWIQSLLKSLAVD